MAPEYMYVDIELLNEEVLYKTAINQQNPVAIPSHRVSAGSRSLMFMLPE